jgi:phosphomannomutase/phosphomannomutase/phosphoglucomutase
MAMPIKIGCFKAYDIRGQIPNELNADVAYRIGNATVEFLSAKSIVLGRDIRLSSDELADAVAKGINDAGAEVLDIGLCGTEVVYFATGDLGADGGIMVTASHNPADYNGLKLVREESKPISADSGLLEIKQLAEGERRLKPGIAGKRTRKDVSQAYIDRLLSFIDVGELDSLKIVCNAGNGGAGLAIDLLEPHLPLEFIKVHHEPDGTFPNGVPNPMLEENRGPTVEAIKASGADFGIAWDGDFDRCFFFDETGRFIEGYYIVGLLAEALLGKAPNSSVIYDPRLTWNTIEIVESAGGNAVQSKSGHSFIKEVMRKQDALYGGEMSAHHYFRDFFYCDSGMIPWLLVAQLVSTSGKTLSELVNDRMRLFPASGEINRKVADASRAIEEISNLYGGSAKSIDTTDGISLEYDDWRFNLRASNTEPVIRLNVESRGNESLMKEKVSDILSVLDRLG